MDFSNRNLMLLFEIGGQPIYLTQTLLSTWLVILFLSILAFFIRYCLSSFKPVPSGVQSFAELMVEGMERFAAMVFGNKGSPLTGYFFTLFVFILCSNYTALLGFRPPTSDLATTASLALITFVLSHLLGIRQNGIRYFKEYFQPVALFLPLNIIGELAKPISLCFRLFGNILGGVIIFGLIYELFPTLLQIGIPAPLHAYFDLFVGALQAFIFTILSMTFVQQKAEID